MIGLVMSIEFVRKYKFKKLERPIYMRNIDNTFNYKGQIEYIAKVRLFYKRYKWIKINVMEDKNEVWS